MLIRFFVSKEITNPADAFYNTISLYQSQSCNLKSRFAITRTLHTIRIWCYDEIIFVFLRATQLSPFHSCWLKFLNIDTHSLSFHYLPWVNATVREYSTPFIRLYLPKSRISACIHCNFIWKWECKAKLWVICVKIVDWTTYNRMNGCKLAAEWFIFDCDWISLSKNDWMWLFWSGICYSFNWDRESSLITN